MGFGCACFFGDRVEEPEDAWVVRALQLIVPRAFGALDEKQPLRHENRQERRRRAGYAQHDVQVRHGGHVAENRPGTPAEPDHERQIEEHEAAQAQHGQGGIAPVAGRGCRQAIGNEVWSGWKSERVYWLRLP